jgi:subtilisin family serine protease
MSGYADTAAKDDICGKLATDENYYDFIIENNTSVYDPNVFGCMIRVDENWSVGYGELPKGLTLSVADLNYHTIPKLYAGTAKETGELSHMALLSDGTRASSDKILNSFDFLDASGVGSVLSQPLLNAKGQGVIIGVIDGGIDYTSDALKSSPIDTRIAVIWNQNAERVQTPDEDASKALFGRTYSREDINRALAAFEEGLDYTEYVPIGMSGVHDSAAFEGAYAKSLYTGGSPSVSHAASVAAAALAVAPEAELAAVSLKPAKKYLRDFFFIPDDCEVYEETDIMLGVAFLLDFARQKNRPLVILLPLACGSGPRTGDTPLSRVLSNAAARTNTAVVTSVGNEAANRGHLSSYAIQTNQTNQENPVKDMTVLRENSAYIPHVCELYVGEGSQGVVLELWAGNMDILSVGFTAPGGEAVARIPAADRAAYSHEFLLEKTRITVDYQVVEELSGFELIFIKMYRPTQGVWRINVYGSLRDVRSKFNVWLNMRELIDTQAYFLTSDPDVTLLTPSADSRVISVGGWNYRSSGSDVNSGRGYNASGDVKPDITAPSVNIPTGSFSTGTSLAAAQVAGMAALLLSWGVTDGNDRLMGNNQIKSLLTRGAMRESGAYEFPAYPNPVSGYGRANIMDSFLQLRIQ